MVFILLFATVAYHTNWYAHIENSLQPWNKLHLVMMYDPFNVLLDSIC